MLGDVWYIAHVSCVAFTLLALAECSGKRRPWLVGLWFALACGSRFPVVLTLPAFAFWLASGFAEPDARPRRIVPFLLTLAPFTLLWVGYNEARWHVPWDIGHSVFYAQDVNVGADGGAPFSLRYFPYQLWSYFVQPLHVQNMPPYIVPDQYGQALTWTSPALLLAFFARGRRALIVSVWCAAVLAAGPAFLYYVNGFVQFGMRHALDFEAFLFVLMALAARRGLRWYWNALITYSALAGIYGSWYWNTFFRTKY
jgi:hypothetical protein